MSRDWMFFLRSGRPAGWRLGAVVLAGLVVIGWSLALGGGGTGSDDLSRAEVQRELKTFFEVYLGRDLTRQELTRATTEFIALFGEEHCSTECTRVLSAHLENAKILRTDQGGPKALALRHAYLGSAVYGTRPTTGFLLTLLEEPDAIAVRSPIARRVMTEADVAALADLVVLARGRSAPPSDVAGLTKLLESAYGEKGRGLPVQLVFAAELSAGIERHWSDLSAQEQDEVRAFINDGDAHPLSVALWGRLLEMTPDEARQISEADGLDRQYAAFYRNLQRYSSAILRAQAEWAVIDYLGIVGSR